MHDITASGPWPQGWQDWTAETRETLPHDVRLAMARHAGGLHCTCTHEPPADYTAEEVAAYDSGAESVLPEWELAMAD